MSDKIPDRFKKLIRDYIIFYEESNRPHASSCECHLCECWDAVGNTDKKIDLKLWEQVKP